MALGSPHKWVCLQSLGVPPEFDNRVFGWQCFEELRHPPCTVWIYVSDLEM